MSNEYLTVAEVADKLKVHRRTVRRWIRAGKLAASRIPGPGSQGITYRIPVEAVEAMLAEDEERSK